MATDDAKIDAPESGPRLQGDALDIRDVLAGIVPEGAEAGALGVCLTLETVGNNTVVSIDLDGPGPTAPVQLVTLSNVTGVTLQDVLTQMGTDH